MTWNSVQPLEIILQMTWLVREAQAPQCAECDLSFKNVCSTHTETTPHSRAHAHLGGQARDLFTVFFLVFIFLCILLCAFTVLLSGMRCFLQVKGDILEITEELGSLVV